MTNKALIKVNSKVLVWARESLAFSRRYTCEKTKIPVNRLEKLEEGLREPTLDEIKILSKFYKRTIATLLLAEPPKEKPLPSDRRTVNSEMIDKFDEKTVMAVRKARALAQSYMELRQELGIRTPTVSLSVSGKESPKDAAHRVRQLLKIDEIKEIKNSNEALEVCIAKVEALGMAVFQLSLTKDEWRGFSLVDEAVPIIGIRRSGEQAHSKIFTLFHELGHILLHEGGFCDLSEKTNIEIEKWCNAFAAAILIPTHELLQMEKVLEQQRNGNKIWAKKDLIVLGERFHVGPLALLRSLLENKLTTVDFYNEKHQAWNKRGFGRAKNSKGRSMAKEAITEKGRTYTALAFSAYDQNRIDLKDLSDYLGIKIPDISKARELLHTVAR